MGRLRSMIPAAMIGLRLKRGSGDRRRAKGRLSASLAILTLLVVGTQTPANAGGASPSPSGTPAASAGGRRTPSLSEMKALSTSGPWSIHANIFEDTDLQCVDDPGSSTSNGQYMQMHHCNGTAAQAFYMSTANNSMLNAWTIRNAASNKCLANKGGATIVQEPCDANSTAQQFLLTIGFSTGENDFYFLEQVSSWRCIRLPNTDADGTKLSLAECDTDSDYGQYATWTWWG
jgi:Ricin-type beta-trefoil lectin domain